MGTLGNLGGVEARRTPGLTGPAATVDGKLESSSIQTRLALEKIHQEVFYLQGLIQSLTGPAGPPGPPGTPGTPGAGVTLPPGRSLPYPFVVTPSIVFPPDGVTLFGATPYRVTFCEIHTDPEAAACTANTTFTVQNAPSLPTATGGVTIASGSRRGAAAMNVPIGAGQRLYIKAPAALNGAQNLWLINLGLDKF